MPSQARRYAIGDQDTPRMTSNLIKLQVGHLYHYTEDSNEVRIFTIFYIYYSGTLIIQSPRDQTVLFELLRL